MSAPAANRVLEGENPFGVPPEVDLLHPVRADVPHWSETMFFHAWNPDAGVGVFVHTGRWPEDLDLWWAQVIALLPDRGLLVDRSWGRATDDRGPRTGNLTVECVEPLRRWRLRFDGAGEPTTLARMAEGPVGAGRARAFRFDVELEAAAPVWDMHQAFGADGVTWAALHHTQGFRSSGTLATADADWALDGVALRDHSSGPRTVDGIGGLQFFVVTFPASGRVVNGLVTRGRDGAIGHRVWTAQQDGRCEVGTDVSVTDLEDLATHAPRAIAVALDAGGTGGPHAGTYAAEVLHGYTLTLLEPNENVNGAAHDEGDDPLLVTQGTVRVVAPDGEVGWGVVERDVRRAMLPAFAAR